MKRTVRIGREDGTIGPPEEVEVTPEQARMLDEQLHPKPMSFSAHGVSPEQEQRRYAGEGPRLLPPERLAELKEASRRIFETNTAPVLDEARRRGMLKGPPSDLEARRLALLQRLRRDTPIADAPTSPDVVEAPGEDDP